MTDTCIESIEEFGLSKKKKSSNLFSKVGIVGCGHEGQYIARICSSYGIEVIFIELSQDKIDYAFKQIGNNMDRRISNWGATESEKKAVLSRITGSTDYKDLKECDFVIESIRTPSKGRLLTARKEVFEKIESVVCPECIIATNSMTIVVSELVEDMKYKERCINIHFMINSSEARIVEVTRSWISSDDAFNKVNQFVKMINRHPIEVAESVGLVSIRFFSVILNEACEMLLEDISKIEDIEQLMKVGYGMRYGPFTLADIMGLDKVIRWMENLFNEFGAPKYKPSPLIRRLVRQKQYGRLSGKGFFEYDENMKKKGLAI